MTPDELATKLYQLDAMGDEEYAHREADLLIMDFLRSLGHAQVADAFDRMYKWYA